MNDALEGIGAALFDIDGTLVDSNYAHVAAWGRAFAEIDGAVPAWRIHRAIGMDSAALLDELASDGADRDALSAAHERYYLDAADRLRPLPGARELLTRLDEQGVRVVLATSAPSDELDVLLRVLDLPGEPITTDADDVDTAKPDPGIVAVALNRAGVDAADAVFLGDTVWDMVAAGRAGVRAIGVLSGGIGRGDLVEAGAALVVDGVADLL